MNCILLLKIIFFTGISFFFMLEVVAQRNQSVQADKLTQQTAKSIHKPIKGDTLVYYQVLQLHTQDGKEYRMAVLAEAIIETTLSRTRMRIDYMLKRERVYLSRIFFAKVRVLEQARVPEQRELFLKQLEKRFPEIKVWSVLNVNAYFQ